MPPIGYSARMSRRLVLGALLAITAVCACADILGIDDGKVRTEDASSIDAPADVTSDVAADAPADAAIEAATSPLACGTSTCNALTEACCRTGDPADASAQTFACVAGDAGCAGLRVTCDDPSTCAALGHAGEECCAEVFDGGTYATDTACVAPGTCSGTVMCAPGDDELCAGGDSGKTCQPSIQTVIGFMICK